MVLVLSSTMENLDLVSRRQAWLMAVGYNPPFKDSCPKSPEPVQVGRAGVDSLLFRCLVVGVGKPNPSCQKCIFNRRIDDPLEVLFPNGNGSMHSDEVDEDQIPMAVLRWPPKNWRLIN